MPISILNSEGIQAKLDHQRMDVRRGRYSVIKIIEFNVCHCRCWCGSMFNSAEIDTPWRVYLLFQWFIKLEITTEPWTLSDSSPLRGSEFHWLAPISCVGGSWAYAIEVLFGSRIPDLVNQDVAIYYQLLLLLEFQEFSGKSHRGESYTTYKYECLVLLEFSGTTDRRSLNFEITLLPFGILYCMWSIRSEIASNGNRYRRFQVWYNSHSILGPLRSWRIRSLTNLSEQESSTSRYNKRWFEGNLNLQLERHHAVPKYCHSTFLIRF